MGCDDEMRSCQKFDEIHALSGDKYGMGSSDEGSSNN